MEGRDRGQDLWSGLGPAKGTEGTRVKTAKRSGSVKYEQFRGGARGGAM